MAIITSNNGLLSIVFYTIEYKKVLLLLELLKVKSISLFFDKGNKYSRNRICSVTEFMRCFDEVNESCLLFDGEIMTCQMDKELELLSNRKVLVDINWGEHMTTILVNIKNAGVTEADIRRLMRL